MQVIDNIVKESPNFITYKNVLNIVKSRGYESYGYIPYESDYDFKQGIGRKKYVSWEAKNSSGKLISVLHIFTSRTSPTDKKTYSSIIDNNKICPHNDVLVIIDPSKNPGYSGVKNITRITSNLLQHNSVEKWDLLGIKHTIFTEEEASRNTDIMFKGSKEDLMPIDINGVEGLWLGLEEGQVLKTVMPTRCMSGLGTHWRIARNIIRDKKDK